MELASLFATLKLVQTSEQAEYFSTLPTPVTPDIPEIVGPDNPPWGSGIAFGSWVISVLLIMIVPTFFLVPYAMTRTPPMIVSADLIEFAKSDTGAILLQIAAIIPAHLLTLLLGWLIVTRYRKYSFKEMLGWRSRGISWWFYPAILISFLVLAAVVSQFFPEQENDMIRMLRSSNMAIYLVAFLATVTAPIVEELVYRGILYSAFQRTFGVAASFILVTLLFALVHVPQYYPSFSTIFLILLLSMILTGMRIYSKNLLPCIILHTLFNGIQSVALVLSTFYETAEKVPETASIFHMIK